MLSKQHKIKELMRRNGIEGAIVASPENFHYVTGFASHQHTVSRQPGFASAVMRAEDAIETHVIAMDFEVPALQEKMSDFTVKKYDTWVGVREWDEVVTGIEKDCPNTFETSMDVLRKTVEALDLANKSIGIEMDFLPLNYYNRLRESFPEAEFVNISDLFIFSRSVKTTEEISVFRRLTRVADEALSHASRFVRIGTSECQVAQEFRKHVITSGCCAPSAWSTFNTGIDSSRLCLPSDRRIQDGDTFKFDGGVNAEFDFYTTDTSRTWIVGNGHPALLELKDRLYEGQRKMIEAAKPGLPINELFHIGFDYVKEKYGCYRRGHLGHSISMGPQTAEAPYIHPGERRPLEVGMVLCVEVPCYIHGKGGFNIEDMILITEDGCEILTYRTPHYL
ncbi:M24 family metallopeptidase [Geosporobacter ferrireducens]|uniref:M24 family metallopeptidase n=1 Tax=Geosporobacter ferrireducens TaxID=1424294 RepID=UPI00139E0AFA|nr:Xaa-Pro peptidase family protein [Geosporobacter ferrireducens]MTI53660.1 aminopeptidase P family protein [Geosporobacter ferrireducens]